MRASEPTDPLGPVPKGQLMPVPAFRIGTRVRVRKDQGWAYFRRRYLRGLIQRMRAYEVSEGTTGRIHDHRKGLIRSRMMLIDNAEIIEVAGVAPVYGLPVSMVCHVCYVGGVAGAASPVTYHYHLLFVGPDRTCIIPKVPMAGEYDLEPVNAMASAEGGE